MSDMMENKLNAEELTEVTGGVGRQEINVKSITPIWVKVTASVVQTADQRSPRRQLLCIHLQAVHTENLITDLNTDKFLRHKTTLQAC